MTNQLNKESIKSRLDRIRQTSSNGDNSPINSISEVKEESKAISTKETSEMRNEFESVLQSGNMTKDKFAYFIQQANEMFQNYEKQLMFYKKKVSSFDYKELSMESKDDNHHFSIIPRKKEVVMRELAKMTTEEAHTLNEIKVAYTDKICELLEENETYKNMIDKLTFDVINRLQEKINELGEMLKKEIKEKETLDNKLKTMDSVFQQNSQMKEEIDIKDEEIANLTKLRDEHEEKIKNLSENISGLQLQIENYLSKLEEKNKIIDDNESIIKKLKSSIEDRDLTIEEKSTTLKEKENEIELLCSDNIKWEEKYNLVSKEIENFKKWSLWDQNLIESYKKIESLELDILNKQSTIDQLNEEATHIKQRNEEISNELTLLKGEVAQLRTENDSLKVISKEYETIKDKYKDYDQLLDENIKSKKELSEIKEKYEKQISTDKEEFEMKFNIQKSHYETEIETQKQHFESLIVKKENEYENKSKGEQEKIEEHEKKVHLLQKCIDELNSQLDKKNEAIINYKDAYEGMIVKVKAQEERIYQLERNPSTNVSSTIIPTNENKEEKTTKAYSTFDKYAFTKDIMVDYLYCLSVCESGITMPQLCTNISKNLSLYLNNIFLDNNNINNPCVQCEIVKDIYFVAYDKVIQKKMKTNKNYDDPSYFMINFEDFNSEIIKEIVSEIQTKSFISRVKAITKIEQLSALFVKKYTKSFDFDVNLGDYVKDKILPCVVSRINRISRNQSDEMRTLVDLILHNIKDGSIYIHNKEVYSFEEYFKEYLKFKTLENRNEKLIIEKPIINIQEIDNITHNFKFEKPNELYMTNCFIGAPSSTLEPKVVFKTILNNILLFLPKIQVLSLPMNHLCGEIFTNELLETVKLLKDLHTLDLSLNTIGDDDLKPFSEYLKVNKTIKTLILDNNNITTTGGFFLADALMKNKTLSSLSLNHNQINESGFTSLINALTNSNSTLQNLSIANNNLQIENFNGIAEYFNANPPIVSLDLSGNQIDNTSANVMGVSLKKAKNLHTLKLSSTGLNEESGPQLLNFIPDTNVEYLELDNNNIGKAMVMLINKIKITQSLKVLSLKKCSLVPTFLSIMAENVKSTNIEEIHLENNTFDEESFKQFVKEMEDNTKIVVSFSKAELPKKAEEVINGHKNILLV